MKYRWLYRFSVFNALLSVGGLVIVLAWLARGGLSVPQRLGLDAVAVGLFTFAGLWRDKAAQLRAEHARCCL